MCTSALPVLRVPPPQMVNALCLDPSAPPSVAQPGETFYEVTLSWCSILPSPSLFVMAFLSLWGVINIYSLFIFYMLFHLPQSMLLELQDGSIDNTFCKSSFRLQTPCKGGWREPSHGFPLTSTAALCHAWTHTHMHSHTRMDVRTYTHSHTYTHTPHTHTCMHKHSHT